MGNKCSKIYLDPINPWTFEGHQNSAIYGYDDIDEPSEQYFNYVHKYGPKKGNSNFPDGYVIVWGASQKPFNGIYHSNAIDGSHIYQGAYMKSYRNNFSIINIDNETQHFLKFSRCKGIKIVPKISKYVIPSRFIPTADKNWNQSPKNDKEIAHFRWKLIQNTKQRLSNNENIRLVPQPKQNDKETISKQLQKHYDTLMNVDPFEYKYIYKYDHKLK
eukprot:287935_1